LARVVGERRVKKPLAKGEALLGGPPLQLEAAGLHPAGDPVEDVGEGERLELAGEAHEMSLAGPEGAAPPAAPRPTRRTTESRKEVGASSASTARPASRPLSTASRSRSAGACLRP